MGLESSFDIGASGAMAAVAVVFVVIWLAVIAFSVVSYVLLSRGMQMIARRRGIRKSWLAWIPVANMWTLGSISDQYQYVVKGKIRSRRKVLLGLMIGYVAIFAVLEAVAMALSFGGEETAAVVVLLIFGVFGAIAVALLYMVFLYIALYDLYASCDPGNAVLYLVLSIVLNVTMPFFVFACRNKDGGMPQRKVPQSAAPVMPEPVEASEEAVLPAEVPVGKEDGETAHLPEEEAGETAVLPEETSGEATEAE